jgi:hypothetical protein
MNENSPDSPRSKPAALAVWACLKDPNRLIIASKTTFIRPMSAEKVLGNIRGELLWLCRFAQIAFVAWQRPVFFCAAHPVR